MDVIILCGGKGTRLAEQTANLPKPMVEIGGMPILWHIMKLYSYFGYKRFILAIGYKADKIKQFFYSYRMIKGNFSLKLDPKYEPVYFDHTDEKDWEIIFVDTGLETLKGSRIKRLEPYISTDIFHLTYGDGVSTININELVKFHKSHGKLGTITAVRPPSRFGELLINESNSVIELEEKPQMKKGLINGGFFVFHKGMLEYLNSEGTCDFEFGPLQRIAEAGQLKAFIHEGFWQCMDNVRERDYLDNLVNDNNAPWMHWRK